MTPQAPSTGSHTPSAAPETPVPAPSAASEKAQSDVTRTIDGHRYGIEYRAGKVVSKAANFADSLTFTPPPQLPFQKAFRTALLGTAFALPHIAVTGYVAKKAYDVGVKHVAPIRFVDRKVREAGGMAVNAAKDAASVPLYPVKLGLWAGSNVLKVGVKTAVEIAKFPIDVLTDIEQAIVAKYNLPKGTNLPAITLLGAGGAIKKGIGGLASFAWHHPYITGIGGFAGFATLANAGWNIGAAGTNVWNALMEVAKHLPGAK